MKRLPAGFAAVAIVLFSASSLSAEEISIQGSNEARWADGRENFGGQDVVKRYFEDRLNLDLYYGKLRFSSRFTMLQPSEFGEHKTGVATLDKRFIEYTDDEANLSLRVGDLYTVWGRGLGLSLVEDILQGFDSGLDGAHGSAGVGEFELEALSGRSEAGFLGQVRDAQVSAAQIVHASNWGTTAGAEAILVRPVENDIASYPENRTWAGYLAWDGSSASLWAEYATEDIEGVDDTHDALYTSGSWYSGKFSLFADYKRYRYFRYPGSVNAPGSAYSQSVDILPFHSPPIVQREFTSALFSKHPHIVRFDDEVGAQVEGSYNLSGSNTITLNYSQSSSFIDGSLWIPTVDEEDSPYRQVFAEFAGYPSMNWYLTAWSGWDEDLVYKNEGAVRARTSWLRRTVAGAESEVQVRDDWSVKLLVEGALVEDVDLIENSVESLSILGATWKQKYSLSVTLETAENDPNQDKSTWLKGEFSAFIANRHELLVTVGEERGGLVCTSGKCRVVAPFEGVKVTLTSIF